MIIFLAYKIHCSDATHEVLVAMGGFLFEPRGTIEVKVSKKCLTKCGSLVSCLVQAVSLSLLAKRCQICQTTHYRNE